MLNSLWTASVAMGNAPLKSAGLHSQSAGQPPRIDAGPSSKNIWVPGPAVASIRIKPRAAQGKESSHASDGCGSVGGRAALDKFLDQELRKTRRVMPHHAVFLEQIVEQAAHT